MAPTQFSAQEYQRFRDFLERACGILLGDNKQYLVASRLSRVMGEYGLRSLNELMERVEADRPRGLRERIVEAMTTNETYWFRDRYPFEVLKSTILPDLAARNLQRLRIWTAACSSGQEAYSVSMVIDDFLVSRPGSLPEVQIIGSDISPGMLEVGRRGEYDGMALSRGLSEEQKQRYFTRRGERWQVKPHIRERVSFYHLNLLESYALLGRFDVIFCRNVLIYFSTESKRMILARLAKALQPWGYLFLGASESVSGYSEAFDLIHCNPGVVYRLRP